MASDTRDGSGTGGQDTATGARPAAVATSPAWGRSPTDLAADEPAGGGSHVRQAETALPGTDDVTGGRWGVTNIDLNTGGDIRRGRPRDLHPEVDPDSA